MLGLLIKEHVSFSILDTGFRHLSHTLVVKFIPQIVHIIPAIGYVVAIWEKTGGCVRAAFTNLSSKCEFYFQGNECRTLVCAKWWQLPWSHAEKGVTAPTHCWQCHDDR